MRSPRVSKTFASIVLILLSVAAILFAPSTAATTLGSGTRGALPKDATRLAALKAQADVRSTTHQAAVNSSTEDPVIEESFEGVYDARWTPSDSTGAIGTRRYLELVNTTYGLYDRSDKLLSTGELSDLTPGISASCGGDPQTIWDPDTQRFYVTNDDFCGDRIGFAWSKTASPNSADDFCSSTVSFGFKPSSFVDYQKLGDSSDFLLVGINLFQGQVDADVAWVPKPPPGTACTNLNAGKKGVLGPLTHPDGTPAFTPVPANGVDPSSTGYVMSAADPYSYKRPDFLTIWKVRKNSTTGRAVLAGRTSVDVPVYQTPSAARQPGTNSRIDTLDTRLWEVIAAVDPRFGKLALWTSHAVFGGAGSEARWYEIDPSAPALLQSGSLSDPDLWIFNPSISSDRAVNGTSRAFGSNMVLNVSTSGFSDYSAIQMISKRGGADESEMVLIKQSPGFLRDYTCPNCRWGDYSSATPDPAADPTGRVGAVWGANQWNVASATRFDNDWRTWIWKTRP